MAKEKATSVALDALLQESAQSEETHRGFWTKTKLRATAGLAAMAVMGSAMALAVSAPYTLLAAGAAEKTVDWWDSLPHDLADVTLPERTVIKDDQGKKFATVFTENRVVVPMVEMSPALAQGLVATEDSRFYQHSGMDPKGIARAVVNNLLEDDVQGASTITQQLVENIRIALAEGDEAKIREAKGASVRGKLEEVRLAQGIEESHTKDEILETYFNIVYFGNGAYGVEAAAQRYFDSSAKELTVPQAATLVAMLKSPVLYDPISKPEESRLRRDVVMKRMVEVGYLSQLDYEKYIATPTKVTGKAPKQGCAVSAYPFYCQMVINRFLAAPEIGETKEDRAKVWRRGGLVISTPMNRQAMKQAQAATDRALGRENRVGAGVAQIKPGTGQVVAIGQNRTWGASKRKSNFEKTQIVYADSRSFQTGSTFKPITAATAIEAGFGADTRIASHSPQSFSGFDQPSGGFKNDGNGQFGSIDMKGAMKSSVNTYFVGLTHKVGVTDVAAMARRLGMKSVPANLTGREGSITLGTYETSPIELASVYATFAGRGVACDSIVMTKAVHKSTKKKLRIPDGNCHQEISPAVADTVSNVLLAPMGEGGTGALMKLKGRKAAGKTGTTNDSAATWFAGYTPTLATAVWIGDPRGGSKYPLQGIWAYGGYHSNVFGRTVAGPIWTDVMNSYHTDNKIEKAWFPKPGGVGAAMTARVVPTVTGMDLDSAVTTLLRAGFKVELKPETAKPLANLDAPGYVARQSPKSGRKAAYGDTIKLVLTAASDTAIAIPRTLEELEDATIARSEKDNS